MHIVAYNEASNIGKMCFFQKYNLQKGIKNRHHVMCLSIFFFYAPLLSYFLTYWEGISRKLAIGKHNSDLTHISKQSLLQKESGPAIRLGLNQRFYHLLRLTKLLQLSTTESRLEKNKSAGVWVLRGRAVKLRHVDVCVCILYLSPSERAY